MPSKLSVHLSSYPNNAFDILARMQPGVVKVFNQSSEINIDAIRARCPNAIIVYRQYTNLDYHGSADQYFAELQDTLNKLRGRGILWEGINEPILSSVDDAKALNAWFTRYAQLMHGIGELVAAFSWSTGNPTPDKLPQFIPYLVESAAAADAHAFHEYYSTRGGEGDWGRYRAFEEALPDNARRTVVITEAGLDDNGDPRTGGWRGKVTAQEYLEILKQYDALLMQDPYVLGATVYQWGDGAWPSFDLTPMIDLYSNYVASVGGGVVTPKPWPVPIFTPPVTKSFTVTPTTILAGQTAALKWDVEGVQSVFLDGVGVAGHGTQQVSPTQTTTYTLHIVYNDNTTEDLTVTLAVEIPPSPTFSFTVVPETVNAGDTATLQWDVENVREVYLNDNPVTGHGTLTVTPAQTTTYTLHIILLDGSTKDLTATVTVIPAPNYSFTVSPSTIQSGQSATLTWNVESAQTITLDAELVPAQGTRTVTPTQTTTYTLHVQFLNGTEKDLPVTVTVQTYTRPPTVTITPENIALLQTFPRPTMDNGRGLHFNIDLRQTTIENTVPHLVSIGCKWTMIYAQDELQAGRAAKECWESGIMPIVRIGKKVDEFFDPVRYVDVLKAIGAPPYVQIYNEPGDGREWKNWPGNDNWKGIFAGRWAQNAQLVYDAGGYPGLQVLGKDEFYAAIDAVKANNRTDIFKRTFFAIHNYGANHPPAYPYDARNQQDHPGDTILDDEVGVLSFLLYATWMKDAIGFVVPIIGGEGGWEFGASEDNRYPKVEQPYHADYHKELFNWFRTGVVSNGEPLPDYLFSITPWIEGGWGADDWWGGPLGDKTETIQAIQAIPAFVRKFSWDGGTPIPPTYSFTATPTTIQAGGSAVLEWNVSDARTVTLNGQAVASQGTQTVTPSETTTYTLHIVFNDNGTQDLTATVTVTPVTPSPTFYWDPRLDDLGVKLKRTDAANAWRLISAIYQGPDESGGNHHIYFTAQNPDGTPRAGLEFVVDWVGRDPSDQPTLVETDAEGKANCPLWAILHPEKKDGPYFTLVEDEPSDTVSGMGLPVNRHVNYLLTFRKEGVVPPSPTFTFTATPTTIQAGESATLAWQVTSAQTVTLDGQTVASQGTRVVTPTQDTTYTLHIVFIDNSTRDLTATVQVTQPSPTVSFTATPQTIQEGQSSTLAWSVQNARVVTLDGQSVSSQGSKVVSPTQTTTYTLHVEGLDGSTKDVTVTVTVTPAPPVFTFTATPPSVQRGGSSTLAWNVTRASSVTLDGQVVASQGSQVVTPAQTTTYTLHIVFVDNSTKDLTATVTVLPSNKVLITDVVFSPTTLSAGNLLNVSITVWNDTSDTLQTQGPNPGFVYNEGETFRSRGFAETRGAVRVGVDFDGRTGIDHPYRWGLGSPLAPGQTITVAGQIRFKTVRSINYWAGLVRELIAWVDDRKGPQKITVTATPTPPPAPTFTATPTTISSGQSSTLAWNAPSATGVTLNGQAVAIQGTQAVTPSETTTYTLHVVYADNSTKDLTVTVTVNVSPPPSDLDWDARLDSLGVTLQRTTAAKAWRLQVAKYQDPTQSGGKHHVYFKALNVDGSPASGIRFVVDWVGRDPADDPAIVTTDANGEANCPLWAGFKLQDKNGIYFTTTRDAPGDTVRGLGLPNNQFVNFLLTFRLG